MLSFIFIISVACTFHISRRVDRNRRNRVDITLTLTHSSEPLLTGSAALLNNSNWFNPLWPIQPSFLRFAGLSKHHRAEPRAPLLTARLILYPGQVPSGMDSWFNGSPCSVWIFVNFPTSPLPSASAHQSHIWQDCLYFIFPTSRGGLSFSVSYGTEICTRIDTCTLGT